MDCVFLPYQFSGVFLNERDTKQAKKVTWSEVLLRIFFNRTAETLEVYSTTDQWFIFNIMHKKIRISTLLNNRYVGRNQMTKGKLFKAILSRRRFYRKWICWETRNKNYSSSSIFSEASNIGIEQLPDYAGKLLNTQKQYRLVRDGGKKLELLIDTMRHVFTNEVDAIFCDLLIYIWYIFCIFNACECSSTKFLIRGIQTLYTRTVLKSWLSNINSQKLVVNCCIWCSTSTL